MNNQPFQFDRRCFLAALGSAAITPRMLWASSLGGDDNRDPLRPYDGPTRDGVDRTTLHRKVMCGYQGWFNAKGDGAQRGWVHWVKDGGEFKPGNVSVDLWPDMAELGPTERFKTGFRHADGRVAEVFSSYRKPTVVRHFKWMSDYGIDGAFVQRFIHDMVDRPKALRHHNAVLSHAREGANRHGRTYALMYDLTGLSHGRIDTVAEDLEMLCTRMRLIEDPAYLRHRGRPVVAVWGVGFGQKHRHSAKECRKLVDALKDNERFGGLTVMLGVPTHWRTRKHDASSDPAFHDIYRKVDVLSPWTVGRFRSPKGGEQYARNMAAEDLAWCSKHGLDYLPVAFPGFSWANLTGNPDKLNEIPRRGGKFLWSQATAFKRIGANMLYVAMFDEVDESTAIFKCTNTPPVSKVSKFLTYEGLPSDHYLKITGRIADMFRGKIPPTQTLSEAMASSG